MWFLRLPSDNGTSSSEQKEKALHMYLLLREMIKVLAEGEWHEAPTKNMTGYIADAVDNIDPLREEEEDPDLGVLMAQGQAQEVPMEEPSDSDGD
jgi:hypothetical protein